MKRLIAGALMLVSTGTMAVREQQSFHVSVSIPTHEFYVLPVDSTFLEREQVMHWDAVNEKLKPLRTFFDVKNASGAVSARLAASPTLYNGREHIELQVHFNEQLLSLTDTPVVDETQARLGKRVRLDIGAITPGDGYVPGAYYGTVHLMFEAVNP